MGFIQAAQTPMVDPGHPVAKLFYELHTVGDDQNCRTVIPKFHDPVVAFM